MRVMLTPVPVRERAQDDPNALSWCMLCAGQAVPPLPSAALTCPPCPAGEVCSSCTAGEAIDPDTTMYITVGTCPACSGETKSNLHVLHTQGKKARAQAASSSALAALLLMTSVCVSTMHRRDCPPS
jgi:hypothetical protein